MKYSKREDYHTSDTCPFAFWDEYLHKLRPFHGIAFLNSKAYMLREATHEEIAEAYAEAKVRRGSVKTISYRIKLRDRLRLAFFRSLI